MNTEQLKAKCPSCGTQNFTPLPFGGYCYHGKNMPLVRCGSCDLMFVVHNLTVGEIENIYNEMTDMYKSNRRWLNFIFN